MLVASLREEVLDTLRHEPVARYEQALALSEGDDETSLRHALELCRDLGARPLEAVVARRLRDTGYGRQFRDEDIEPAVERAMWTPAYEPYRPA